MFAELFGHHFNQFSTIFLSPRRNPHPLAFTPASLSVSSLPPLIYFLSPWSFLFWIFCINGIRQYSPFCVCLLSFEPLLSRLSHVKACISSLFPLRLINISLYGYAIFLSIQQLRCIWVVSIFWLLHYPDKILEIGKVPVGRVW